MSQAQDTTPLTPPAYPPPVGEEDEPRRRRPGGRFVGAVLFLLALPVIVATALRGSGFDAQRHVAAVIALTPYVLPAAAVLALLTLLFRRWLLAILLVLCTALLAMIVLPRAFVKARPLAVGEQVRILSVNLLFGRADPGYVVDLVRRTRADAVSLQELTPEAVTALDAAGLAGELPFRVLEPGPDATGTGIASRHPLSRIALGRDPAPGAFAQPSALINLPGPRGLELMAVHPRIPVGPEGTDPWLRDLGGLPEPRTEGPARVLAGDFNATLDHSPLRRLLGQGYQDAADQTGAGLTPTWPGVGAGLIPPPVTLDHVLVDKRCPVDRFDVFEIPGSDHRAILATITVPEAGP
ncbi:endonuclease/exonuclease/phosphatase (EEP) superfamily protein YafD [Crossiella equi]|uniref:Endonuclease/exonuclease/phosphatase (EEP) superfamily protein YafD n=1 Tax=Crossiella equi TaxID=130796 RepID=A0ABS5AFZ3_9PSEU|nr:endonuclease/exonuclease/phosphatase family protein [Crossiella equi]MBP2475187.1 endonuclease/exonuclease/phosphatase (EEP) superfamily protein YafD [Crossiella equi]